MTGQSTGIRQRFDRAPEGHNETGPSSASTTNIFGGNRGSAILGASNYLRLAAAPTCAIMALLTGVNGSPTDLLCSAAHDASPLSGMAAMYLLMSIFHAPPWLKLLSSRRKRSPRGRSCA
jgi:hypothetical protein